MASQPVADAESSIDLLIESGRLLDAVDALTELNADRRAPELEIRLAALRRDAFAELEDLEPQQSDEEPAPTDPFHGHDGLPEIERDQLSAELLRGTLYHHGVLMVRGLVDRPAALELSDGVDRTFEEVKRWRDGAPPSETAPWFVPLESHPRYPLSPPAEWVRHRERLHRVLTVDSPRVLFDLFDALRAAGLDGVLRDYLGSRPVLIENKFCVRQMPYRENGIASRWHQEAAVFGAKRRLQAVNVWLSLSACGIDSPAIEFLPAAMSSVVDVPSRRGYGVPAASAHAATGHCPPASPNFEPGDAVLFNEMVFHRTRQDEHMTGLRRNVEAWFFAPWGHPGHNGRVVF